MTKKPTKFLFILLLIFGVFKAHSQNFIDPEIQKRYPSSVYSRVYEITLTTLIPHDKQIQFANFFIKKDSLIETASKQDKSIKFTKNLIDSLETVFDNIFDKEQLFKYNYFKYKNYFDADAKMNASYYRQKFNTEKDIETSLYKLNLAKNQRVLKAVLSKASFDNMPDSNKIFYGNYDSIVNKYIVAANGEKYFRYKIEELNQIKSLSEKDKIELKKNYQNFCLKNGNNYYRNFNAAMQFSLSDSVYYKLLYQDSIKNEAKKQSDIELENYVYKYNLNDEAKSRIATIILEKANKNVWLETRYYNNRKRDSLQTEVNEMSWSKIKNELVRIGYTNLDKGRFVNAIKLKQVLRLTNAQIDTLIVANLSHDLMTYNYKTANKGASPNFNWFVTEYIKTVLTEGQYDTLLLIEVQPQAVANAKQNWEELKHFNLTSGIDSIIAMKQIISYHMSLLILTERYSDDRTLYNKLAKENKSSQPEILKKLDAAKKEEGGNTKKMKQSW